MDLNDMRALWTVVSFVAFLGIVLWVYSRKRKARFEEDARLPLEDDDLPRGQEQPGREK